MNECPECAKIWKATSDEHVAGGRPPSPPVRCTHQPFPGASLMRFARKILTMCEFGDQIARLGTDPRIKVGCAIFPVDCSAVLGIGYNGAAAGLPHDSIKVLENPGTGRSGAAHAEANALVKMRRTDRPAILYSSTSPCSYCAPLIVNAESIVGVVQGQAYDGDKYGREILDRAGIPVVRKAAVAGVAGLGDTPSSGATAAEVSAIVWWMSLKPRRLRLSGGAA